MSDYRVGSIVFAPTPGPWIVHSGDSVVPVSDAHKSLGGSVDPEHEARVYAKVIHGMGSCDGGTDYPEFHRSRLRKDEAIANARLIAAAPELLAALRGLVDVDRRCVYGTSDLIDAAITALAKAEGR